ncbi:2-vinyl bacteriochlorophyllide hydratase [Falsiroseomonas sp.]|jgi:3-vinyl bacteriochlorophyllide hydratase|uniref:2-vinyl bacteriochlorophyllide hydratase n=1 Tax=Falsiroseomonas sp. TaxID=2870721 RepID=UPI003F72F3E6
MLTTNGLSGLLDALDASPWGATTGRSARHARAHGAAQAGPQAGQRQPLYTEAERQRRDASPWTLVQGILAPLQFAVFLVSLGLVARYLATGEGLAVATASVVVKTVILYVIMVTGSIWEKVVFGRWLFAPAFYWEDVFSMLVLGLHTAYLGTVLFGIGDGQGQMLLALAAYAAYLVNAAQFVLKLRAARRDEALARGGPAGMSAA